MRTEVFWRKNSAREKVRRANDESAGIQKKKPAQKWQWGRGVGMGGGFSHVISFCHLGRGPIRDSSGSHPDGQKRKKRGKGRTTPKGAKPARILWVTGAS